MKTKAILLLILIFIFSTVVYAGACKQCVRQCEKLYERCAKRCDNPVSNYAYAACLEACRNVFDYCIMECFELYDHDCDQYVGGGGGGMGTCHYEVETGTCVPYAN